VLTLVWPVLALVGCHGPSLAFVGLHWLCWASVGPALTFMGPRWPVLAFVGPALGCVGLQGPSLAFVGPALTFVGPRWPWWWKRGVAWWVVVSK
jgi:hypothetical protein